mmetsp:Transcript_87977/g.156002  ORF Transcript_87977/g.156002 Transcript_87977/m.156002 type:complete len:224 (+) Transcript_87977:329-1000(+)
MKTQGRLQLLICFGVMTMIWQKHLVPQRRVGVTGSQWMIWHLKARSRRSGAEMETGAKMETGAQMEAGTEMETGSRMGRRRGAEGCGSGQAAQAKELALHDRLLKLLRLRGKAGKELPYLQLATSKRRWQLQVNWGSWSRTLYMKRIRSSSSSNQNLSLSHRLLKLSKLKCPTSCLRGCASTCYSNSIGSNSCNNSSSYSNSSSNDNSSFYRCGSSSRCSKNS